MRRDVEMCVLRGFLTPSEAAEWKQDVFSLPESGSLLESLMAGDLEAVLRSPQVSEMLAGDGGVEGEDLENLEDLEDLEARLERRMLRYLDAHSHCDQSNRELVLMALAVACLHSFAQSNWTGPPPSTHVCDALASGLLPSQSLAEAIGSSLVLDGESTYSLVAEPFLLLLARVILTKVSTRMNSLQLLPWWTLRYVSLHQQILEERSMQLFNLARRSMQQVLECEPLLLEHRNLAIQFHLECVYANLTYYEYQAAKTHIKKAQELSKLGIGLTGALGKRTRYQQKSLAQLVLEVKRQQDESDPDATPTPTPPAALPKDRNLDDDTVLDKINLEEPDEFGLPDLSAEEQAVILGVCVDFQKNNPVHKLTQEELLSFTSCLLSQPKFWAVEVAALCLRSKLERGSSRCVERAMMQTQAIVDHFEDKNCPVTERLKVFYCSAAPTRWTVQKQLASLLMDLGCTSSALLMYERLEMWEDVVICYERLGQHGKAEEIVRRELEKTETAGLYCLLGDILRDHQYYDRAWELSGQRSSRAMRSKALLHLQNKELQECVDCFEKSVKVNCMQLGVWFSLGCAYLALEGYEGAAKAFQTCVRLEPDNAEAWNNLSTAFIRMQKKDKAFRTLREALRCNYEHWQIWENFIVVSIDVGDFAEAIKAYHRLMDLRENYKDVEIIQILVRAVTENLSDARGQQAEALRSKLKELLGRVSSRHSADAEIWRQYALLYGSGRADSAEDDDKALQFLSKAHRCEVQAGGWEKEPGLFREVISRALHMAEVSVGCSRKKSNASEALQLLSSSRLSLRALAAKAKQMHTDVATGDVHAELQDGVEALERLVGELQELSAELRARSQ